MHCRRYRGHEFDPWVGKIPWRAHLPISNDIDMSYTRALTRCSQGHNTNSTKNLGTMGVTSGQCHLAPAGQKKPASRTDKVVPDSMEELESTGDKLIDKSRNEM